ncbi:MAG: hypothetical protein PHW04_14720 [Candidatus Wallbacteria bacterium]|nr:hypothetical protein [Candidatus Wallbacteria bacterium]
MDKITPISELKLQQIQKTKALKPVGKDDSETKGWKKVKQRPNSQSACKDSGIGQKLDIKI